MAIHIGKEIKAELQRQERGVTWIADKLHCDRTNVYKSSSARASTHACSSASASSCTATSFPFIVKTIAMTLKMILHNCRMMHYEPDIPIQPIIHNFAMRKY